MSTERLRWIEGEPEIVVGFIPLPADRFGGFREVVEKQFFPKSLWEKAVPIDVHLLQFPQSS
jgi:hypothetical protein